MEATAAAPLPSRTNLLIDQRWILPVAILLLAVIVRLPYLPVSGSPGDHDYNARWGDAMYYTNIEFYRFSESNHPPLYPIMNALTRGIVETLGGSEYLTSRGFSDIIRLKLPGALAELVMIGIAGYWLRNQRILRWGIPLLMALHPGLIANSTLWSQSDPINTMFLVIAILLLRREKPGLAWVVYALALLTKFQSIVLLPLMVVLTYRRFPLLKAITSALTGGAVFAAVLSIFVIGSGFELTMRPYAGASIDLFPNTTVNAYNLWMFIEPGYWEGTLGSIGPLDGMVSWFAPLNMRQAGFIFLGAYTLLICVIMLRRAREPREFVWAAALYFGFFMLPTQIHERYLYTGVIMSIFAIAQDRRMLLVPLVTLFTFTMNMVNGLVTPYYWVGYGLRWLLGNTPPLIAFLNVLLLIEITLLAIFNRVPRILLIAQRAAFVVVIGTLVMQVIRPPTPMPLPDDAVHMSDVMVEDDARMLGYRIPTLENNYVLSIYWEATQPIYGNYIARVDVVDDGEIVATTLGSYLDQQEGSWRWLRGRLHWTTYDLDMWNRPRPDKIYVTMLESATLAPLQVFQRGVPAPGGRILLIDLEALDMTTPSQ